MELTKRMGPGNADASMAKTPQNKGRTSCLSPEHYTPASHIACVRQVLERIDLDPGSSEIANRTVRAAEFYTEAGEIKPWHGRVFCNPPGDRSGKLVKAFWLRAVEHAFDGGVVLWAAFAGSQFFRLGTFYVDGVRQPGPSEWPFVPVLYGPGTTGGGRIKWISGKTGEPGKSPGHHNFYCLLGGDARMRQRFRDVFSLFGPVTTPASLPRPPRPLLSQALDALRVRPATKSSLARALGIRKSVAIRLVDRLVESGRVVRRDGLYAVTVDATLDLSMTPHRVF